jgi:hypothetical protein
LNIIKLTKKSNALFFAALLLVGTIAASSPLFMLGAQAEPYYGMDKDRKVVSVSSLKCNNINVNVNGLELDILPPSLSTLLTGGEVDATAYSYGSGERNYGSESSGSETDFRFICINNNNNTFVGVDDEEPTPPRPTTANLNVNKLVTCQQEDRNGLVPSIQQISLDCDDLLTLITEDQFNIGVTDTNVSPSNFKGSETGTLVTLGAGPFTVTEEPDDSVAEEVETIEDIQTDVTGPFPSFSGDCTQTSIGSFSATGDIAAGGQETCNIVNNFVITEIDPCEACFNVDSTLKAAIEDQLVKQTVDFGFVVGSDNLIIPSGVDTIEQLCPLLKGHTDVLIDSIISTIVLIQTGSTTAFQAEIDALIECLIEAGVIVDTTPGLTASNINTSGGLTHTFSSPPTIAQGTEEDLSALEKITKLKQQWLELLP